MHTNLNPLKPIVTVITLALMLFGCNQGAVPQPESVAEEKPAKTASPAEPSEAQTKENEPDEPNEEREGELHLSETEITSAGIVVEAVQFKEIADQLVLTANIAANQDRLARIAPRIEGRLIKVSANLGDRVKAGQSLAVIDSIQMGEARAEYRRAQSELKLAESVFQRADRLLKEQVVPQRQWLEASSIYERAKAATDAATERLRLLGGAPGSGESSFTVNAPFAGVVIEKKAVLGDLAQTENNLFTVADLSNVWIEADVTEQDLGKLAVGMPATVTVAAYPNDVFKGTVSYIANTFDRQTRTVKARIELPNPDGRLRIDMFARAAIDLVNKRDRLALPQEAVLMIQGQFVVYVATDDGFEARPVALSERLTDRVVIASGLLPGENVVVSGAYALKARQLKSQIGDAD